MDNRVFNVNGKGKELLLQTLTLAFAQSGFKPRQAAAWFVDKEKGLVLCWHGPEKSIKANVFPTSLGADSITEIVFAWLQSDEAKTITLTDWDRDADHDGSNSLGWRVYCESWGHVKTHYAIVAIKPAYMWYGK